MGLSKGWASTHVGIREKRGWGMQGSAWRAEHGSGGMRTDQCWLGGKRRANVPNSAQPSVGGCGIFTLIDLNGAHANGIPFREGDEQARCCGVYTGNEPRGTETAHKSLGM